MPNLPTSFSQPSDYHWSPINQRAFLEELGATGLVTQAAKAVSMSKNSAYRLSNRSDGLAFRIGWEAAISVARRRVIDDLMERAIEGYEETVTRSEDGREITRYKYDTRLALTMIQRFDARLDGPCDGLPASELAFARIVAQDFEAFLDLIERGGGAAQLSLFLAARSDLASVLSGSHLAQISDDLNDDEDYIGHQAEATVEAEYSPEDDAERMSVWYCDEIDDWRTDFPPLDNFDGEEEGRFGDHGYERSLTSDEERIQLAVQAAELRPLRDAAEEARERWFGGEAAKDVLAELAAEALALETARATRQAERVLAERERAADEAKALADAALVEQLVAEIMPEADPAEPSEPPYDFAAAYQPDDPNVALFYHNA